MISVEFTWSQLCSHSFRQEKYRKLHYNISNILKIQCVRIRTVFIWYSFGYLLFGFWRGVHSPADASVSVKHTVSIFSPEDGNSMFLRNVGIYRRVHTSSKPRTSSSSSSSSSFSPPWNPQFSCIYLAQYRAATRSYPEPAESSPHHTLLFTDPFWFNPPCLGFPSGLVSPDFPTSGFYLFSVSPVHLHMLFMLSCLITL
jgi:hypothetical protein